MTIPATADMTLEGAFVQNSAGGSSAVFMAGDIITSSGGISFGSSVILTCSIALNSSAGTGTILFADRIDGAVA